MKRPRKQKGQILLPGLGVFVVLVLFFYLLVAYGERALWKMRMDTAAQAAALSASRAQAQLLNDCATHNLIVNIFVNLRFNEWGAMQLSMVNAFTTWLAVEDLARKSRTVMYGFRGYVSGVGHTVARCNGALDISTYHPGLDLKLQLNDLFVFFLSGYLPAGGENFSSVYYSRLWGMGVRKAQPDHRTTWLAARGTAGSSATARVYLDIQKSEPFQNGGFPHVNEKGVGQFEIQSFYPQFNARLSSTAGEGRILERLHHLENWP